MTLEGCIVKLSDVISYSGRDLEDAIRLNFIKRRDIPDKITKILGDNNRDIVNTLVCDVIKNSKGNNYIKLSDDVFDALQELVQFNYQNIYNKANSKEQLSRYEMIFNKLYDYYLNALNCSLETASIYTRFLYNMTDDYKKTDKRRIVIDYISLMTDEYLMEEYSKIK